MQLKRFIQFSVFFLILIGLLSYSAGFQSITEPEYYSDMEHLNVQEERPVDPAPSLAEQDLEINQLVWHFSYSIPGGEIPREVVECEDGNYCFVATLNISSPSWKAVLIKIDPSGNQLWNKTYVHANATSGTCLVSCSDGGLAIGGDFSNNTLHGLDGGILIKTNSTGHPQWNVTFYDAPLIHDIIQVSDGGFVVVGLSHAFTDTEEDVVVIRTDENGTRLWTKYYGSYEAEEGYTIIECESGGYAILGIVVLNSFTIYESFFMRLDDSGNLLWYRTYGADVFFGTGSIIECDDGDFLLGGDPGMLRTDSNGNPKSSLNFHGGFRIAIPFGDNRIAGIQNTRIGVTDENQTLIQQYNVGSANLFGLVRCENGEFIAVGVAFNDINIVRIPWLDWNQTMNEVECEYLEPLSMKVNATCSQGIESWSIDDISHFQIDSQGLLSNASFLDVGEYPVEIVVNDTLGNHLIQRFTVIVEDTTAPTWLQAPGTVFLEAGIAFLYDLNATDASGALIWSLGATYAFSITQAGVITNTMQLTVGTYHIDIFVEDTSGNSLHGTLILEVEDHQNPVYILPPSNLEVPYGEIIEFDIVAYDVSGIDTWIQNCTDFTMLLDTDGSIATAHFTSNGALALGIYYIAMDIADFSANMLQDVFLITVTEATTTTTTSTTTTTTTSTTSSPTSSIPTGSSFDGTQILVIGLGSGIGGAILMLVVFQFTKRRSISG